MADIKVGYPAVYHDPTSGKDRPAVVAGEVEMKGGRKSKAKFDILVLDAFGNIKISACNKGAEAGEFELV